MVTVASILKSKGIVHDSIAANASVLDALVMMNSMNIDYLVVMENDHFQGVFCEHDYTRNVILKDRTSRESKVQEVMTPNLPMISPQQTAEECMKLMDVHKIHYLPVFNAGQFCGVVTMNDVMHKAVENKFEFFDEISVKDD